MYKNKIIIACFTKCGNIQISVICCSWIELKYKHEI